jgi:hypothetical protein
MPAGKARIVAGAARVGGRRSEERGFIPEMIAASTLSHAPHGVEVRADFGTIEDVEDLHREGGDLPGELRMVLRRPEEVDELFADEVSEGLLETEPLADVARGLALVDPDLVELAHRRRSYNKQDRSGQAQARATLFDFGANQSSRRKETAP